MPGSIKTLSLLNRIMRGALTSVMLNDALSDPATLGAFKTGLTQRAFCLALINDAAVAAIVFAGARAASACFESAVMRKAIWESDTALSVISASPVAKAAMRSASGVRTVSQTCSTGPIVIADIGSPCLLVGWSFSTSSGNVTLTGRRYFSSVGVLNIAASAIVGTTAAADNVMALGATCTVFGQTNSNAFFCVLPL